MNPTNPYQSPIASSQIEDRNSGSWYLIGGVASFLVCLIVVGFVMVLVIPEMKDAFEDMNRPIPGFVEILIKVADHFVKFWIVYLIFGTCVLIWIERSGERRKQLRISAGIAVFVVSTILIVCAACASFLAMT